MLKKPFKGRNQIMQKKLQWFSDLMNWHITCKQLKDYKNIKKPILLTDNSQ